jgi:hypothetical protein
LLCSIGLALPIVLVYAGQFVRSKRKSFPVMLAFLITGSVGILFYNLFPACGPQHLLPQRFPFFPLPIGTIARVYLKPVAIEGPCHAIPSLPMAWTLLAWWYSRGLTWWERSIAMTFLVFTGVATLGTGEHYFVDLVVAFPLALLIEAIGSSSRSYRDPQRVSAFLFGLAVTLACLVALRDREKLFWASPVVPWALAAATIALASMRHSKLQEKSGADQNEESASCQ